jgi:voltage-gated potassium channel Kch
VSQRSTNAARAHARAAAASNEARRAGAPQGRGSEPRLVAGTPSVPKPTLSTWLRYRFDLTLSRGTGALIGWLAVVTLAFVIVTGALLTIVARSIGNDEATSGSGDGVLEGAWDSLMRTLDPGTVTGDDGWTWRAASLFITLVGIFIFSTLIGLIASVIDRTIESLRKGRGVVPEQGHTVILGWSEKLHTIIAELRVANENQRGAAVVVLSPHDRVWMEDEINARHSASIAMGILRGVLRRGAADTRIVCRTGNPSDPADLALVAPTNARSVIVLADPQSDAPDAQATKVLLGLMSFDRELTGMNVLAEFTQNENAVAMREATGGRVHTVVSSDLIARITAQICRQSGLGAVYQELLDFDGDELYVHDDPSLSGASWGELLLAYPNSSPIGILDSSDAVELNPLPSRRLGDGDRVIAISEDDDTLHLGSLEPWDAAAADRAAAEDSPPLPPDHLLMIGWNDLAPRMLAHLARAVPTGSTLDVAIDPDLVTIHPGELPADGNLEVRVIESDATRVEPLRELLGARDYERILLVGHQGLSPSEADARTLLGLVQARRVLVDGHRNADTAIVAELLEPRSVQLGRVANPDDFVVSERLTSLLLAQVSENPALAGVFTELLDGTGVEIVMRPASAILVDGAAPKSWRDVVVATRELGETAIGWVAHVAPPGEGSVIINPAKASSINVENLESVVVLART